jgi:hypothetical protein
MRAPFHEVDGSIFQRGLARRIPAVNRQLNDQIGNSPDFTSYASASVSRGETTSRVG